MNLNKTRKSFSHTVFALVLGGIAMASINISASEPKERHVMIKIDKTDGQDSVVDLSVDGVDEEFVLPQLNIGESKMITTVSGKEIKVSKNDKGLSINIDGKDISLPGIGANLAAHIQRTTPLHHMIEDSIQVSGVELNDNQKQIIENAFLAAGIEKKITFSNKNIMIFQTEEHSGEGEFTWHSGDDSEVDVIINSDPNVKVHTKIIQIEERQED